MPSQRSIGPSCRGRRGSRSSRQPSASVLRPSASGAPPRRSPPACCSGRTSSASTACERCSTWCVSRISSARRASFVHLRVPDKLAAVADYLQNLLRRPPVGWWDLLDIAIVSILIYEFLKLIRGTRAVQMAVGSLLVIALFYVSQLAPLQTLNWLIRNALVYVAFAAIVIFQSDIRRALAHFGQAPFFRYFNRQEAADETIEEVVVAATMLAQQKVGAIVAIEREIGLRNYIESGIPLDATLTYDLLVTIFKPGSPLHDGAVILQEGRVAAAAWFLPLTVKPRLSRELGTRHRAAIGLTEESDAAAVIVSEETGLISVSLKGEIERGLSPDDLRARLRGLIQQRRGHGGGGNQG